MSEGELKKRLRAIADKNETYEGGEWAVREDFEEVAKEFPSCSKCRFYLKDKDCCPFSAKGENCCPKTDWFKKSFGENK